MLYGTLHHLMQMCMTKSYTSALNDAFIATGNFTGSVPGNQLLVNNMYLAFNELSAIQQLEDGTFNVGTFTLTTTYKSHFSYRITLCLKFFCNS